ncbi:PrgI family protein [Ihubacter sp. mB4P-1]|uniref:PrgI family protein n=1 Tax=Ihubacter sp. mB4P-1 TaxID=3242370 RepID=UPI003C7E03B1
MIEIKVNDEIRDVRAEFLAGLTIHQMIWCGVGLLLCGGGGLLLYFYTPLPLVLITYLVVFIMLPFGAMAFITWHEMDMLAVAKLYITRNLLDPVLKTYGSSNQAYLEYQTLLQAREKAEKKQGKRKEVKKDGDQDAEAACS